MTYDLHDNSSSPSSSHFFTLLLRSRMRNRPVPLQSQSQNRCRNLRLLLMRFDCYSCLYILYILSFSFFSYVYLTQNGDAVVASPPRPAVPKPKPKPPQKISPSPSYEVYSFSTLSTRLLPLILLAGCRGRCARPHLTSPPPSWSQSDARYRNRFVIIRNFFISLELFPTDTFF